MHSRTLDWKLLFDSCHRHKTTLKAYQHCSSFDTNMKFAGVLSILSIHFYGQGHLKVEM